MWLWAWWLCGTCWICDWPNPPAYSPSVRYGDPAGGSSVGLAEARAMTWLKVAWIASGEAARVGRDADRPPKVASIAEMRASARCTLPPIIALTEWAGGSAGGQ